MLKAAQVLLEPGDIHGICITTLGQLRILYLIGHTSHECIPLWLVGTDIFRMIDKRVNLILVALSERVIIFIVGLLPIGLAVVVL